MLATLALIRLSPGSFRKNGRVVWSALVEPDGGRTS
jgi:hypothetical protein